MDECAIACNGAALPHEEISRKLTACQRDTLTVSSCRLDATTLGPIKAQAHPDLSLRLEAVSGTVDLQSAQLREVVVLGSKVDRIELFDATVDRVRIAPSTAAVPDAYQGGERQEPARVAMQAVDARGCHARMFALVAADVTGTVDLGHARVDDTLDLTWSKATTVSLRFGDVLRLEGARLQTDRALDLFGTRTSQVSLNWAHLGDVNLETATVDRVLSLREAVVARRLDASWLSAGALVVEKTELGSMELGYAHLGILDIGPSLKIDTGPIVVDGLHVDAVSGDIPGLTGRLTSGANTEGAFHSLETALRNAGRNDDANAVAFEGEHLTALIAAKLPRADAAIVLALLFAFVAVAYACCKRATKTLNPFQVFLCALDIVLPSFVDIGAVSAWTNYSDRSKENADVKLDHTSHNVAFVMRILGTMAFTYLLLYVANLRG